MAARDTDAVVGIRPGGVVGLLAVTWLVLSVLFAQARDPRWALHLSTDLGVYALRAHTYVTDGSWAALTGNEYQPGALAFFVLASQGSRVGVSFPSAVLMINAFLLLAHVLFLARLGGLRAAGVALVLFLAAGPISLFRFELLVTFLILAAVGSWLRGRHGVTGVLLGLATSVKVYPLFLLLPLLAAAFRGRQPRRAFRLFAGFAVALVAPLLWFVTTGGSVAQLAASLQFHTVKPVSDQSVPGMIATLVGAARGLLPPPVNTYGIHGLVLPPVVRSLTTLGLLLTIAFLLTIAIRAGLPHRAMLVSVLGAVVLALIAWPPLLQPQYLLWALPFTALLVSSGIPSVAAWGAGFLHLLALITAHVLYPVRFDDLLAMYAARAADPSLLPIIAVNCVALVGLAVLMTTLPFVLARAGTLRGASVRA